MDATNAIKQILANEKRKWTLGILAMLGRSEDGTYKVLDAVLSEYADDEEVVLAALQRGAPIKNIKCPITREFVIKLLSSRNVYMAHIRFIMDAHPEYADDEEIILASAGTCDTLLQYASERLRNDKRFIITYANKSDRIFDLIHIPVELRDDEELILSIKKVGSAHISPKLWANKTFSKKLVERDITHIWRALGILDADFIVDKLIENELECEKNLKYRIRPDIFAPLLKRNGMFLKYIPKEFRTPELIGLAVIQNKEAAQFV